jgi:hypothetical protein
LRNAGRGSNLTSVGWLNASDFKVCATAVATYRPKHSLRLLHLQVIPLPSSKPSEHREYHVRLLDLKIGNQVVKHDGPAMMDTGVKM